MNLRLKRYKKEFEHAYTFGVYPVLEMLKHSPRQVLGVVAHPAGSNNTGVAKIRDICHNQHIPFEVQEKVFSRLGVRENDYAVGIFSKLEKTLEPAANHLVLVNPSGMGNLGTIIRTMLGFNHLDLAIIQPAADIFHPDVIKASMGAFFQLRFERFPGIDAYRDAYPRNLYLLMTDGEISLTAFTPNPPFGLVFGNESSGLTEAYKPYGTCVSIPQSERIDSFNLAVAVGVTLYQVSMQEKR